MDREREVGQRVRSMDRDRKAGQILGSVKYWKASQTMVAIDKRLGRLIKTVAGQILEKLVKHTIEAGEKCGGYSETGPVSQSLGGWSGTVKAKKVLGGWPDIVEADKTPWRLVGYRGKAGKILKC